MDETPNETGPANPMLAGMEGLIVAMKDRKPAPRDEDDIGLTSTELQGEPDEGDALAGAPWHAIDDASTRPRRGLARGTVVGRYVVLQELGVGGMGVVYAAYDPELDRKVALKLLLPGVGGSGRTRLLREAQTLAKLSHPNVVAIHDVGTVDEQVWLAMEFVQGRTLRQWLATPRSWRDVVTVMRRAGEGLAAAHAAGILHRDFKPDNVMVGDDERVRVMDFGLARGRARPTADDDDDDDVPVAPKLDALALQVTRAGTMLGTPAYMAAEQFDGRALTAAADQLAFCVTLWEALYGERPFAGESWMEIAAHVAGGVRRAPPRGRPAPAWLRRACERGLAVDPGQRWPSMHALLDTLATGRTRARIRTGLTAMGVLALLGASIEGHRRWDVAQRTAACEATGDEIAAAWNAAREQGLREAILATKLSYAMTTADKTVPWLERQAEAWRQARVEACLDADVRGTLDAETLDRSLWCLEERRMQLQSLVDELSVANESAVQKAVPTAAGLDPVAPCLDAAALEGLGPTPEQAREAIGEVRASLSRTNNLRLLGRYEAGLETARSALARAQGLEWPPLAAAARLHVGLLLNETGAHGEAEPMLEDAYFEATAGVAPEVNARAAVGLVRVVGVSSDRHAEGLRWGRLAEVAVNALAGAGGPTRITLLINLANVHSRAGHHDQARQLYEQALSMGERELGSSHPVMAAALNGLAALEQTAGRADEAEILVRRVLAIREEALGDDHPDVASAYNNLGLLRHAAGDHDEAVALLERALTIRERALGPGHLLVADTLNNLGLFEREAGATSSATLLLERALAIRERALGPKHPKQAESLHNLALVHYDAGRYEDAEVLLERAIAIREEVLDPDHLDLASSFGALAVVHHWTGEHEAARRLLERTLAIEEKVLGPEHPLVAGYLCNLADVHWDAGNREEAEALYERVFATRTRILRPDHPDLAASLHKLARARQWKGDRDGAEALAARALAIYEHELGPDHPSVVDPLMLLAELAHEGGRPGEAIALAERAVAVREHTELADPLLAQSRFVLARVLWDAPPNAGRDRTRALALATQARDVLREARKGARAELATVEAWLAERETPP